MGRERIRSVTVTIVVDTSHQTRKRSLEHGEDESREEFAARVAAALDELTQTEDAE